MKRSIKLNFNKNYLRVYLLSLVTLSKHQRIETLEGGIISKTPNEFQLPLCEIMHAGLIHKVV